MCQQTVMLLNIRACMDYNVDKCIQVGPCNISGQVLWSCRNQLAGVLTKFFNQSQAAAPLCLKSSTTVPRKNTSSSLKLLLPFNHEVLRETGLDPLHVKPLTQV